MNDPRLVAAAEDVVSVLVRRPHAYRFREDHPEAPIPGLVVLDPEGRLVGAVSLLADAAVEEAVALLRR